MLRPTSLEARFLPLQRGDARFVDQALAFQLAHGRQLVLDEGQLLPGGGTLLREALQFVAELGDAAVEDIDLAAEAGAAVAELGDLVGHRLARGGSCAAPASSGER